MLSFIIFVCLTSGIFIIRWSVGAGLYIAFLEMTLYVLFLSLNYRVLGKALYFLLFKNSIVLTLLLVLILNLIISSVMIVLGNSDFWLQVAGLNFRNILILCLGVVFYIKLTISDQISTNRFFWVLLFGVFLQLLISVLVTHGKDALLLFGVGASYAVLFAFYLFVSSTSWAMKALSAGFIVGGNSFTAIFSSFISLFLHKPKRMIIPVVVVIYLFVLFIDQHFGELTIFRKSPEMLLSGTGRFDIYRGCFEAISNMSFGRASCHSSYLTLVVNYAFIGIMESIIVGVIFLHFIWKNFRSNFAETVFLLSTVIFISANDFLLFTPSTLTLAVAFIALRVSGNKPINDQYNRI